ncbi:ABC transporter ATP-binding protein [Microbacterium sp. NPDC089189]|uniref:ABC transporter ATP-binding protein n=1 Tax=Microbacterium sp. NPDC089189 TaxID=3154972 RepID=UPI00341D42AE
MTTAVASGSVTSASSALPAARVRFEGVGRTFGTHTVLQDIDLTVAPGELVAILGASGSGKSTLLRIAGGLDSASEGRVLIDDEPVTGIDPRVAVGFQEPRLLPWRSVAENIALGLPRGLSRPEQSERIAALLSLIGLTDFADHRPRQISGGMAQRTSLARALARRPGVLLLDEPFGALDALTRLRMQDLLLSVLGEAPTTTLLVTHDVDEALQVADRIIVLGTDPDRPGARIQQLLTVPGDRPRDRGSAQLAEMRADLLGALGIDRHAH